jgi:hypothetical protein
MSEMTTRALEPREARTAFVLESLFSVAFVAWGSYLLWPWQNLVPHQATFALSTGVTPSRVEQ